MYRNLNKLRDQLYQQIDLTVKLKTTKDRKEIGDIILKYYTAAEN